MLSKVGLRVRRTGQRAVVLHYKPVVLLNLKVYMDISLININLKIQYRKK
jgi:hypothetical protein